MLPTNSLYFLRSTVHTGARPKRSVCCGVRVVLEAAAELCVHVDVEKGPLARKDGENGSWSRIDATGRAFLLPRGTNDGGGRDAYLFT